METKPGNRKRGRPPAFIYEKALDSAMQVFWAHGYEGATMGELTHAMGMNKASIYGAFGDKETLFRKTLEKYVAGPVAFIGESLNEPTARQVVEKLLTTAAGFLTDSGHPAGCMVIQGALTCGAEVEHIQGELAAYRRAYERALGERFERAKAESDLPATADCAALARLVAMVHQGMSVQASSGATKEELLQTIGIVLGYFSDGKRADSNVG